MNNNMNSTPKVPDTLAKIAKKPRSKAGMILLCGVILFVVAVNVYKYYKNKGKANSQPNPATSTKSAEVLMFYTDWCPHCISAKPEWNKFKEKYKNTPVKGYQLTFNDVNCTKESAESERLMEKYSVDGFPTIKLVVNGKTINFDAKPTEENLTTFVNSALN
jgi:thiol-disulfide isomerase/thioredoxin